MEASMFSQGFIGFSQQSNGMTQTQMTQVDTEVATRSDPTAATSCGEDAMASPTPQPWLKIHSTSGKKTFTFSPKSVDGSSGLKPGAKLHVHKIGRSSRADVTFKKEERISNLHAEIYCSLNQISGELEPWIKDTSSNGTWLKKLNSKHAEKLSKGEGPRRLHNGDQIAFLNGELRNRMADWADYVFDVTVLCVNLHNTNQNGNFANGRLVPPPFTAITAQAQENTHPSELNRPSRQSSVLTRAEKKAQDLVQQMRNISDYYEFIRQLGKGAQATVYLAREKSSGEAYAVKSIHVGNIGSTTMQSVLNEANLLCGLSHRSITQLKDVFADESHVYLVIEMMSGGDLFDRIVSKQPGGYAEGQARAIMRQILEGIAYLHSKKVVHRDIKPENILLVSRGSDVDVKITDFGLAKRTDQFSSRPKTICGTEAYFAPEILASRLNSMNRLSSSSSSGDGTYGVEVDMWSCGVLLYVIIAGNFPWHSNNGHAHDHGGPGGGMDEMDSCILQAKYSFDGAAWSRVSDECKDLVRKLLVKEPRKRVSAVRALKHVWFTSEDGSSAGASSSSATTIQLTASTANTQPAGTEGLMKIANDSVEEKRETSKAMSIVPQAHSEPLSHSHSHFSMSLGDGDGDGDGDNDGDGGNSGSELDIQMSQEREGVRAVNGAAVASALVPVGSNQCPMDLTSDSFEERRPQSQNQSKSSFSSAVAGAGAGVVQQEGETNLVPSLRAVTSVAQEGQRGVEEGVRNASMRQRKRPNDKVQRTQTSIKRRR